MSDMSELLSKLLTLVSFKPYNQSNLQKKIYSERILIEIIVIIVKEHL